MKLFDLHCDTLYECYETGKGLRENDLHLNRAAVQPYAQYAQFFALFCGARSADTRGRQRCLLDVPPEDRFAQLYATAHAQFCANADWLTLCRSYAELAQAHAAGKCAAFLSIEGAELIGDASDGLERVYEAGVRMITLVWNRVNRYACPAAVDQGQGLTEAGRALVRACADKGILIDVSHLSERGFWDVCDTTDAPLVASHSNAYACCAHKRNLTDEQLTELARRGGLCGLNLYAPFLTAHSTCTLDDALAHIDHILSLSGGTPLLALGGDWDGCDRLPREIRGIGDMGKLEDAMRTRGYPQAAIEGMFYDNAQAWIKKMLP